MLLDDDACVINGQELILDCEQIPYSLVTQVTPYVLKNMITIVLNAYGTRFKGIYCINVPSVVHAMVNFCKPFLSEKMKNRVHTFSEDDLEKLYDHVPRSLLSVEYGGNAGTSAKLSNDLKLKIESYSEWFKIDSQVKTSEIPLGAFEVEGSFRKLDID
ncbi:hypothetical protein ILUMI_11162 [Ignelater luminosus]|uniref:CRAL-TRIO domain-containing protein n=1 Tax=Ignelater luminosus TaxID=2038154 RepID=A0A8K0D2L7_IGNLU|nr:hypothetical protein ILUMI_11162 [Ignelater luminosus]